MGQPAGVLKIFTSKDVPYYTVEDVMVLNGVAKSKAYQIIKSLRTEMVQKNLLHPDYPAGKIPKKYFNERNYI